jgi:hypothetical protein
MEEGRGQEADCCEQAMAALGPAHHLWVFGLMRAIAKCYAPAMASRTSRINTHHVTVNINGGRVIDTPRGDMFIVRSGTKSVAKAPEDQRAGVLMARVAHALSKPGVKRTSVFRDDGRKAVYAYSVDPQNPDLLVREDSTGKKTSGSMVNGVFRITRGKAVHA